MVTLTQKVKLVASTILLAASAAIVSGALPVLAQVPCDPADQLCGLKATANAAGLPQGAPGISTLAAAIIDTALGFLGTITLLVVLYSGFLYLTSAGNEEKIGKAKKLMVGAVIGIFIILTGYGIAAFIIKNIKGTTGTTPGGGAQCQAAGGFCGPESECPVSPSPLGRKDCGSAICCPR